MWEQRLGNKVEQVGWQNRELMTQKHPNHLNFRLKSSLTDHMRWLYHLFGCPRLSISAAATLATKTVPQTRHLRCCVTLRSSLQ